MYDMPAVIFAGGKSSRMGEDKALLPFGDYGSLSEFQYQKLKKSFTSVYISCKENKFDFDAPLILDTHDDASPLVALVSIFTLLDADDIFVLSVDAPLIDESVFETLVHAHHSQYSATIAQSPRGIQPLCAIYNRSILPLAQEALSQNRHKLSTILNATSTQKIVFSDEAIFTNVNTPSQYKALLLH